MSLSTRTTHLKEEKTKPHCKLMHYISMCGFEIYMLISLIFDMYISYY